MTASTELSPLEGRPSQGEERSAGESNQERRERERDVWRKAFLISLGLHVLLFLLWPATTRPPEDPFAAAGPRSEDDRAAEGMMRSIALRSAPPTETQTPVAPVVEVDLEVPEVEMEVEPEPEADDVPQPELTQPGVGATEGTDAADGGADAGVEGGTGAGDGGDSEEGLFRVVPPAPRGMIIPPTNSRLRGQEIRVWVFVNEGGRVVADSTRLEPPTSDRGFNEQIIREAARWVFQPARQGEKPVSAWFPYTIGL
ncbi:MAG: hypothetical protein WD960_15560 [Gemmatimonadota bacterium]